MSEDFGTPDVPDFEEPKKNKTPLIIGIVAAVGLCCCCILLLTLWYSGDAIMEALNQLSMNLLQPLLV